jgi:hypothetical protein
MGLLFDFQKLQVTTMANSPTDGMINVQKELLAAYEQGSRTWLARVKSE